MWPVEYTDEIAEPAGRSKAAGYGTASIDNHCGAPSESVKVISINLKIDIFCLMYKKLNLLYFDAFDVFKPKLSYLILFFLLLIYY